MLSTRRLLTVGAAVAAIGGASTALADTKVTATAGPVTIPGVPLSVCVEQDDVGVSECVATPAAMTVKLTVIVKVKTPTAGVVPPTVTPTSCPAGTDGVALQVNTGGAAVTIGGKVKVVLEGDVAPQTQTVAVPTTTISSGAPQTVTVFACAGVSPGP